MKIKGNAVAGFLVLAVWLLQALNACAGKLYNVTGSNLAVHGYDLVSYHSGKPLKGKEQNSLLLGDVTYLFADKANQELFQKNREMYQPAFGGWCAWAMLDGKKVDVNPLRFKIIEGITYLYYTSFFVDTFEKWNSLAESIPEQVLLEKAEKRWQAISVQAGDS